LNPNFNATEKINLFVALAPVAYVTNLGNVLFKVMADLDVATIMNALGQNEFSVSAAIQAFLPDICDLFPSLCDNVLNFLMGPSKNLNESRIGYYLSLEPNPTSEEHDSLVSGCKRGKFWDV